MTRYDEIKKRVQGTTSSQNSHAAGNRQSSYEDIKSSFHPSYEEIKANPTNYDDSDVDINTWFQTSYDDMQKAGSRLKAQNYSDWHNSEAVDLDKFRDGSYAVRAWINRHRGEIGDETADEALEQLDSQLEVIRSLREATASAGNYWSQWDSKEEYDAAVKASRETQMTSSQIRRKSRRSPGSSTMNKKTTRSRKESRNWKRNGIVSTASISRRSNTKRPFRRSSGRSTSSHRKRACLSSTR